MKTTKMPGFTAESSIYDSNNYDQTARVIYSSIASQTIQPAAAYYGYDDTSGSTEVCSSCIRGYQFCRRFENGRLIYRGLVLCSDYYN